LSPFPTRRSSDLAIAAAAPAAAASTIAAEAAAATAHRLGPRFVHDQRAPFHFEFVQLGDGPLRFLVCGHFDEAEAARAAGGHVAHDACAFHRAGTAEQLSQLGFTGLVRKV